MFNEYLFHLCDCTCLNVMCVCVLKLIMIESKIFLIILFAFGSDFYHPCFSKFYKLILCEKHVFWVFSWLISRSQPCREFKWSNSQVFQLWIESFAIGLRLKTWLAKFRGWLAGRLLLSTESPNFLRLVFKSVTRKMPRISFLKGNLWDICFKLIPSSPNPLFQSFYIKAQLNSIIFHSINISKVIFNYFH